MQEVSRCIATGDKATMLESDDLLQCDCVYGGLYDSVAGRFGFRYFHTDEDTWDFDLDAEQIADIAWGKIRTFELWQCDSDKCHCYYPTEDSYCPNCDSMRDFHDYEPRLRLFRPEESDEGIAAMASLRKIGLAILDYHREHGHFPPPFTRDAAGAKLHSWRSLVLPYLERDDLFAQIDFEQPWNADINRAVLASRPEEYRSPDCPAYHTRLFAIVGDGTVWPPAGQRKSSDIKSGTSYTVMAVHSSQATVAWMEPSDLDVEATVAEYAARGNLLAVFVDGHVESETEADLDELRELLRVW